ncbi:MAG: L,D-transpeptidase [Candidatus Kapaibacterium sp.]
MKYGVLLLLLGVFISSCSKEKEEPPRTSPPKAAAPVTPAPKQKDTTRKVLGNELYKPYKLTGAQSLSALSKEIGKEKMFILYKINRRDLKHLKEGETIAVPNADSNEMTYSPFPDSLVSLDSVRKILIVSRKVQAFAAYEKGKLIKWGPTSTGKKATPTPEGLYHTNWKSKETHSTVDDAWVLKWYFNLDSHEGVSLHEYDLPGYPASHSCIRLLSEDAEWIYNWAEQWKVAPDRKTIVENGTPVIVFGEYAFGKNPPWKKLIANIHSTDISEKELIDAIGTYFSAKKKVQLSSH